MTEIGELLPVLPDIALHIIRTVITTQTVISTEAFPLFAGMRSGEILSPRKSGRTLLPSTDTDKNAPQPSFRPKLSRFSRECVVEKSHEAVISSINSRCPLRRISPLHILRFGWRLTAKVPVEMNESMLWMDLTEFPLINQGSELSTEAFILFTFFSETPRYFSIHCHRLK
jgi:hypothetical protein